VYIEKPAKILTKKEHKALEDAEFEATMSEIVVEQKDESKTKTEAVAGDANAKNKKKKEKAKAKKEADEKAEKEKEVVVDATVVELTPEEKKAAVKAAMEKRGNIVGAKTTKDADIAS
jgi:homoserine dehydrogenase